MAHDGQSALEIMRRAAGEGESYDLAILDLYMPKMDGMELASTIKADPAIASTELILLTSWGLRGEAEQAKNAGFSAYLTKPVKQSRLFDAIATVMGTPAEEENEKWRPEQEAPIVTRHSLKEAQAHSGERIRGDRVLVAEDNQVNQKVAVRMLERLGYRADVAADGLEALEALSRIRYAAVLMDVQMPEMDGYEATAQIRQREDSAEGRHIPIIAMTANAMQGDREKALEAGMDDYVPKPIKAAELEAALGRWVPEESEPGEEDASTTIAEAADPPVSPENTEEKPLDDGVIENLRDLGGSELILELTEMFFDGAKSALSALREAIESGDAPAVERVAHTLKGSCGNMGALRMSTICAELEDAGCFGKLERAPALVVRLEVEFGRVRPALEAEMEEGSRG